MLSWPSLGTVRLQLAARSVLLAQHCVRGLTQMSCPSVAGGTVRRKAKEQEFEK